MRVFQNWWKITTYRSKNSCQHQEEYKKKNQKNHQPPICRHILVTILKSKFIEHILKTAREKRHYKLGAKIWTTNES